MLTIPVGSISYIGTIESVMKCSRAESFIHRPGHLLCQLLPAHAVIARIFSSIKQNFQVLIS